MQAWNRLNFELSNYSKALLQDSDQLLRTIVQRIDALMNEKRETKRKLIDEKQKFDSQSRILKDYFDRQYRIIVRKIRELTDLRKDYNDTRI